MKQPGDLLDARLVSRPPVPAPADPTTGPPPRLDRGYAYAACRETAAAHGDTPHIPPKASAAQPLPPPGHPDRHPPRRWVVTVGHRWFKHFRGLLIRWEQAAAH